MKQALQILKEIKNTSSTNDKISILSQHKDNEMLKCILNIVYNPRISTKIAKKKLDKDVGLVPLLSEMSDLDFLNFISKDCTGKDKDILSCQTYLMKFNGEERELVEGIITQKLSIGMDYKNINKSFGYSFIEFYECMKAKNINDLIDKIDKDEEYSITMKLDGFKALVRVDEYGNKTAYSRNGLEYEGLEDFLNELELDKNMLYDGELLYFDDTLKSADRFKKTSEIVRTKGEKNKDLLVYEIYDVISLEDYNKGKSSLKYSERREYLDSLPQNKYQKITKVLRKSKIDSSLFEYLDEVIKQGNEGLIANKLDAYYEVGKRNASIIKFKQQNDVDLLVIGVEEGTGKYKDMLGALVVEYLGYEVKVGSGLSDSFRKEMWEDKDKIIGKIVEIQYMEETQDKDGNYSLRHPRLKNVRWDKNEVSYE